MVVCDIQSSSDWGFLQSGGLHAPEMRHPLQLGKSLPTPHFWGVGGRSFLGWLQARIQRWNPCSCSCSCCHTVLQLHRLWLLEASNLHHPTLSLQACPLKTPSREKASFFSTLTEPPTPQKTASSSFSCQESPMPRPQGQNSSCHQRLGKG